MQYILMLYVDEAAFPKLSPEEQQRGLAAYAAYTEALTKAGIAVGWGRLQPSPLATTLRAVAGEMEVHDGPFTESKEHLGGFYIIDVPDHDTALAWAARCPATGHGAVEVRPLWVEGAAP
jgi:hypothetical protein